MTSPNTEPSEISATNESAPTTPSSEYRWSDTVAALVFGLIGGGAWTESASLRGQSLLTSLGFGAVTFAVVALSAVFILWSTARLKRIDHRRALETFWIGLLGGLVAMGLTRYLAPADTWVAAIVAAAPGWALVQLVGLIVTVGDSDARRLRREVHHDVD